jgi:hypothetical protein
MTADLVLARDARAALVHVRSRQTGECLGCIEVGLFEILRDLILAEASAEQRQEAQIERPARSSPGVKALRVVAPTSLRPDPRMLGLSSERKVSNDGVDFAAAKSE